MKNKKCKRQIIHFGMIKNSSCKTWMAKIIFFVVFSIHHIKLSRFTNHTVQFFKVQILWIGMSWYIHFILWMTKKNQKKVFLCPVGLHFHRLPRSHWTASPWLHRCYTHETDDIVLSSSLDFSAHKPPSPKPSRSMKRTF